MSTIRLTMIPYRMCNGPRLDMLKLVYHLTQLSMRDTYRLCRRLDAGQVVQVRVKADDVSDLAVQIQQFGIVGIRQSDSSRDHIAVGVTGSCLDDRPRKRHGRKSNRETDRSGRHSRVG